MQQGEQTMVEVDEKRNVADVAMELAGVKGKTPPKGFVMPIMYRADGKMLQVCFFSIIIQNMKKNLYFKKYVSCLHF